MELGLGDWDVVSFVDGRRMRVSILVVIVVGIGDSYKICC